MTSLFPAQRAAEEFDQVLGGTVAQTVADRYADLLTVAVALREQPEVLPRADFVGDLRSRLMTAAENELVDAPSVVRQLPTRTERRHRRIGTLAASLVIVGGTAGMAAAASGALPGEGLYPVKRGIEQVSEAVRLSEVGKGEALLHQASTRLDEVRALQAQNSPDKALISETIDSFRSSANEGSDKLFAAYQEDGDTQNIATVRTFTAQGMSTIAGLTGTAGQNEDSLVDAADTVADIDQEARVLCGPCGPGASIAPPGALSSSAAAATVNNLLARPVTQAARDIAQTQAEAATPNLARLQAAAERAAGRTPKISSRTGSGGAPASGQDSPVTSTITHDGRLVPPISSGNGVSSGVKDLVSGVTGVVPEVTSKVTKGKTPLDPAVKDLTDTVDDVTGQILP